MLITVDNSSKNHLEKDLTKNEFEQFIEQVQNKPHLRKWLMINFLCKNVNERTYSDERQ